jgi:hypothetical protein
MSYIKTHKNVNELLENGIANGTEVKSSVRRNYDSKFSPSIAVDTS